MKIIFLDIDGVLNSVNSFKYQHRRNIQDYDEPFPHYVKILNLILRKTDAEIVLSSTWRIHGLDYMNKLFEQCGIIKQIFSMTPRLHIKRGLEIQRWLDDHKDLEIESFVIIDDDSDMEHLMDHLVKTDNKTGLTKKYIQPILERLNR